MMQSDGEKTSLNLRNRNAYELAVLFLLEPLVYVLGNLKSRLKLSNTVQHRFNSCKFVAIREKFAL